MTAYVKLTPRVIYNWLASIRAVRYKISSRLKNPVVQDDVHKSYHLTLSSDEIRPQRHTFSIVRNCSFIFMQAWVYQVSSDLSYISCVPVPPSLIQPSQ